MNVTLTWRPAGAVSGAAIGGIAGSHVGKGSGQWVGGIVGAVLMDMTYKPLITPFLAAGRARGLTTVDGLAMLIGQAATAFEHFFGAPPPREHDAELRAILTQ